MPDRSPLAAGMPCPLRFVLAGVSAAVAGYLLFARSEPREQVRTHLAPRPSHAPCCASATSHVSCKRRRLQPLASHHRRRRRRRLQVVAASAGADASGSARLRRWLQTLLDFFTGRYLYQAYQESRAQQGKAAGSGCPLARTAWPADQPAAAVAAAAGCPAHRRPAGPTPAAHADSACCGRAALKEE